MAEVLTIKVVSDKHPQGWVTLNLSDFDANPGLYEPYVEIPRLVPQEPNPGPQGGGGQGNESPDPSTLTGDKLPTLPEGWERFAKGKIQELGLGLFEVDINPDDMTQALMVETLRSLWNAKYPERMV